MRTLLSAAELRRVRDMMRDFDLRLDSNKRSIRYGKQHALVLACV